MPLAVGEGGVAEVAEEEEGDDHTNVLTTDIIWKCNILVIKAAFKAVGTGKWKCRWLA